MGWVTPDAGLVSESGSNYALFQNDTLQILSVKGWGRRRAIVRVGRSRQRRGARASSRASGRRGRGGRRRPSSTSPTSSYAPVPPPRVQWEWESPVGFVQGRQDPGAAAGGAAGSAIVFAAVCLALWGLGEAKVAPFLTAPSLPSRPLDLSGHGCWTQSSGHLGSLAVAENLKRYHITPLYIAWQLDILSAVLII